MQPDGGCLVALGRSCQICVASQGAPAEVPAEGSCARSRSPLGAPSTLQRRAQAGMAWSHLPTVFEGGRYSSRDREGPSWDLNRVKGVEGHIPHPSHACPFSGVKPVLAPGDAFLAVTALVLMRWMAVLPLCMLCRSIYDMSAVAHLMPHLSVDLEHEVVKVG